MSCFKLGLCSVTFRKKSAEEIVRIAENAGIAYIEWGADVHVKAVDDARKVKMLCDEAGITVSSYGSYFNCADYSESKWIDICECTKEMGASSIRVWLGRKDSEKTSEAEYETLLENTEKMCAVAEKYGLLVCPECHGKTFNNNTDAILKFKEELKKDNFRTYFQSRYFRMEYDLDRIDRTYDFTENVHVSYRDLKREQLFRKKDKYYLDTLLKKFREKDFKGIVMVEFVSGSSEKQLYKDIERLKSY
ncbi:MAG: sugar phosphate isomerase/epimerase [Clostridia bacterium]|nr:sugar phosphate isomerase/epimerase [Clostridia bacterium]